MKRLLLIFLSALLIISSCKKDETTNPVSREPRAGSKWVYTQTLFFEDGTLAGTVNLNLLASDTNIAGSNWLLLKETTLSVPVFFIQKRNDGWWWAPLPNTTPSLWYKTNASVGDRYTVSVSNNTADTAKVVALSSSVTVPAGTFDCQYVQSFNATGLEDEWYFSPDNGLMIKQRTYDKHTTGTGIWEKKRTELVSFQQ